MPTNNGNVPYGAYVVTISSVGYVAENINPSFPTNIIERLDQLGEPSGQVFVPGFGTASMTLQRPTTTTALPSIGATVSIATNAGMGTYAWLISEVSAAYEQGSDQKFQITARKSVV
jgi:hypothetical protein